MEALGNDAESDSIRCLVDCVRKLEDTGFEVPNWSDLAQGRVPPSQPKIGWQKQAASPIEEDFLNSTVWPQFTRQRAGSCPREDPWRVSRSSAFLPTASGASTPNRSGRLRLPLPLSLRSCRCGRPLDALGHHRAACENAGVLERRGVGFSSDENVSRSKRPNAHQHFRPRYGFGAARHHGWATP